MVEVLLVVRPFGERSVGDLVKGDAEIREVIVGEHAHHVVKLMTAFDEVGVPEEV